MRSWPCNNVSKEVGRKSKRGTWPYGTDQWWNWGYKIGSQHTCTNLVTVYPVILDIRHLWSQRGRISSQFGQISRQKWHSSSHFPFPYPFVPGSDDDGHSSTCTWPVACENWVLPSGSKGCGSSFLSYIRKQGEKMKKRELVKWLSWEHIHRRSHTHYRGKWPVHDFIWSSITCMSEFVLTRTRPPDYQWNSYHQSFGDVPRHTQSTVHVMYMYIYMYNTLSVYATLLCKKCSYMYLCCETTRDFSSRYSDKWAPAMCPSDVKWSSRYFPNRDELLLMIVRAFPNASRRGFTYWELHLNFMMASNSWTALS